jgi:DNA-binding LytR/AlgR family response regulator
MKLRALVVEDEWVARDYLVELLEASGRVEIVGAVGSADDARDVLLAAGPEGEVDVAFVDVHLVGDARDDAGLELVRSLVRVPAAPLFVLATAFAQHATVAFDLGVTDYLLKPFTSKRVQECVERIVARMPNGPARALPAAPARVVARRGRALVFLQLDEVWAFEAAERLAFVHSARGTLDVDLSLSAIEASFGRTLLRVHRNWLVSTHHVRELEGRGSETVLLVGGVVGGVDGVRVPVARERAQAVREALLERTMGVRGR